jgi:alpha-maltose-1-phosphate synthase
MSIRLCHPFGNPNSYNAAVSFLESGELERFHTSVYKPFGLQKRGHPELPRRFVTMHPAREMLRLGAAHLPLGRWSGRRQGFVDWVTRSFDDSTAKAVAEDDRAVYCYEDSAAATFQRAEEVGALRIYELPIMHYREMHRILELEKSKEPELRLFLQYLREPAWKLERKDRELLTADVIVVPARFVQRSISRFLKPSARFLVVPYGSDTRALAKNWTTDDQQGPLRLFFAGILGPRKGVHVLFDALSRIPARHYHLTLAGRWEPGFREWVSKRHPIEYDWLGQLAHEEVYEACRRTHVFVFPSLAEGFGLVILEAMASGIPVIATDQTAGPEIIKEGIDGWIIPAGEVEALKTTLETAMEQRDRLPEMGLAARHKAEVWSWKRYRAELRTKVSEVLEWADITGGSKVAIK